MTTIAAISDHLGLVLVVAALYFLPAIVAYSRHHHSAATILVINVFLGWTFIGWVVALAMSVGSVRAAA